MNRVLTALAVLAVLAGASAVRAQESSRQRFLDFFMPIVGDWQSSRQRFLDFFMPIVGDWQITNPEGETSDYTLAFSKSKACFIADNADATHIHGWNPEKNLVCGVSFFSNGNQAVCDLAFERDKTLGGDVTIRNADGSKTEFQLTWHVVNKDRQEIKIGDQMWVMTRRK